MRLSVLQVWGNPFGCVCVVLIESTINVKTSQGGYRHFVMAVLLALFQPVDQHQIRKGCEGTQLFHSAPGGHRGNIFAKFAVIQVCPGRGFLNNIMNI